MEKSHTQSLSPSINLFTASILVVSLIVGSGVFKKTAPMAADLMSPILVLLAWVVAGVITLLGTLTVAELAGMLADSGGPIKYLKVAYGELWGWLYGWSCFTVIQSAAIASIAYVFAESLNAVWILPQISGSWTEFSLFGLIYPFQNLSIKLVSIALIIGLTYINILGVKEGSFISKLVTITVFVGISIVFISALASDVGTIDNLNYNAAAVVEKTGSTFPFTAFFLAMLSCFWAYEGFMSLNFIGGEIVNPNKNIPKALGTGILLVITIYIIANVAYLYAMPIQDIALVASDERGIIGVEVVKRIGGPIAVVAVSVLIMISTLGCTNSTILTAPRLYYKMANEGLFFKSLGKVHSKYKTPHWTLIVQACWAICLVFSGSFDQLTDMLIFSAFLFYAGIAAAVIKLRKTMPDVERPYKVIFYPYVPIVFIVFCLVLIFITIKEKPQEAFTGLFLVFSGLPFYYYWKTKKNTRKLTNEV